MSTTPEKNTPATYAEAGVDIDAGDRAVELIKPIVRNTFSSDVVGDLGQFSGLFTFDPHKYEHPILAAATDGVGTKLLIAQAMDRHDTIGSDLVAMVVNDLLVCGAEPLFLLDYISVSEISPEQIYQIVGGIADACRWAGCTILGGETAAHPGMLPAGHYDVAATAVGVVERDRVLTPERVLPGDTVIALSSTGLHSNGYSLARMVLFERAGMDVHTVCRELGGDKTLGEELLTPTPVYVPEVREMLAEAEVHALANVTGGGMQANLQRSLPGGVDAVIDRSTWQPQPIFDLIAEKGAVEREEMERTFNMGVGMFAIVDSDDTDRALSVLAAAGRESWVVGEIVSGDGQVRTVGDYVG